jgi:hypothetical protein
MKKRRSNYNFSDSVYIDYLFYHIKMLNQGESKFDFILNRSLQYKYTYVQLYWNDHLWELQEQDHQVFVKA